MAKKKKGPRSKSPSKKPRAARKKTEEPRISLVPLEHPPPPPSRDAAELGEGAALWPASGRGVGFIPEKKGERVVLVDPDGAIHALELPSPVEYRSCAALSTDGQRLAVGSRVRMRCVDVATGEAEVVLDGPWQVGVAWIAGDRLAVLCQGGTFKLDTRDPDVAALPSVREQATSRRWLSVGAKGLLHILDLEGEPELRASIACDAARVTGVLDGRILILRREPEPGSWGTAVLGVKQGMVNTLAKLDHDVGEVFEHDGRVITASGHELQGLEAAWEACEPFRQLIINDLLLLESGGAKANAVSINAVRGPLALAAARDVPAPARRRTSREARALFGAKGDWIEKSAPGDLVFGLRAVGEGRSRACLVAGATTAEPVEIAVEPVPEAEQLIFEYGDGARPMLAADGSTWEVDPATGAAGLICEHFRPVLDLLSLAPGRVAVLLRLEQEAGLLELHAREGGGWACQRALPVDAFDCMFFCPEQELLLLSFRRMPEEEAFSATLLLRGGRPLHVGQLPAGVRGAWSADGKAWVETQAGEVCRVERLDEAAAQAQELAAGAPMLALVQDVPDGLYGQPETFALHGPAFRTEFGYIDREGQLRVGPGFSNGCGFEDGLARVAVSQHERWGIVDREGRFVVLPHFTWIDEAREGFMRAAVGGSGLHGELELEEASWGLMDRQGRWLLRPVHEDVGDMRDGRCRVAMAPGKQGFFTREGRLLGDETYEECGDFSEQLAFVGRDGKYGYVDLDGELVIPMSLHGATSFSGGVAAVEIEPGRWGFIDRAGRVLGDERFDDAEPHREGLAQVRRGDRWGYVDEKGQVVGELRFESAFPFDGGMACVVLPGGRASFVNRQLALLGEGWRTAFAPTEGIGVFETDEGKRGFVDAEGRFLGDSPFDGAFDFSEGTAPARKGKRWGYVDTDGRWAIEPRFDEAHQFSEGLAPVRKGAVWGYIDRRGEVVVEPRFEQTFLFCDGFALVKLVAKKQQLLRKAPTAKKKTAKKKTAKKKTAKKKTAKKKTAKKKARSR